MEEEEEEEIAWHRANVWQSLTVLWNCFSSRYRLPVDLAYLALRRWTSTSSAK